MPSETILKNGEQRARYGCVTTWKNARGETVTVYRSGSPREGLRVLAAELLALDDTFRLLCYSTPETVYRDVAMPDARQNPLARSPESAALSQIARPDLLHPDAPTNIENHIRSERAGWRER